MVSCGLTKGGLKCSDVTTVTFLGSRDVIGHVTIELAVAMSSFQ